MAITYFGSAATPADSGTQAGPTVSVTPPGSMATGDLVLLVAGYKNSGVTFAMSNTGGQTWTAATAAGGATSSLSLRLFWCRYNGTWSANPSVTITTGTLAMSVQMHVFRPTTGTNTWEVSSAIEVKDAAASTGMSIDFLELTAGHLGFGAFISNDDNTYTNSSTGFTTAGTAQYRNLQGNDISMGAQYCIETANSTNKFPGSTQATLGADTYAMFQLAFREVAAGQSITADAGTYNLTGTAANLTAQRKITADSGTFALTGANATLSKGFRLTAEAGTFNLTGTEAGLRAQRYLSAGAGVFVWSGTDATLTKTTLNHYSITAESGSFLLTGQAAGLSKGFYLSAAAGAFVLTGSDSTLTAQRKLTADPGTYNYAGTAAGLTVQRRIAADGGSYILTGTDAGLSKSSAYGLDAATGNYVLTGSDAQLLVNRIITLSPGSFLLTGSDASFSRAYRIVLEPGVFILTGSSATLGGAEYFVIAKSIIRNSITGGSTMGLSIAAKSIINNQITAKSIIQ